MAIVSALHLFLRLDCIALVIPTLLIVSVIGFMVIQFAGIVNDSIIIAISNMGSLRNYSPRKGIEIFIYTGWIIYLIEIGWDVYSTYTVFSPQVADEQLTNCTSYATALTIYKAVVLSHWGLLFILFTMFTLLMDPFNCCLLSTKLKDIENSILALEEDRSKMLQSTESGIGVHRNPFDCAAWCRCSSGGGVTTNSRNNALRDMVHVFRVLFDDLPHKYTFLDLVAGFRLQLLYHNKLRESDKDPTYLIKKVRYIDCVHTNSQSMFVMMVIVEDNRSPE